MGYWLWYVSLCLMWYILLWFLRFHQLPSLLFELFLLLFHRHCYFQTAPFVLCAEGALTPASPLQPLDCCYRIPHLRSRSHFRTGNISAWRSNQCPCPSYRTQTELHLVFRREVQSTCAAHLHCIAVLHAQWAESCIVPSRKHRP